jgi:preprotein translocase subunit Sec63
LGKIALFSLLVTLTIFIYDFAGNTQNKLKGFDPYEILGVTKEASLK